MSCYLFYWVIFTLLWSVFFWFFAKNYFKRYECLLNVADSIRKNPKSQAFLRFDRQNWNFWEFYLVGVFLLPIRMIVFIGSIFIYALSLKIQLLIFNKDSKLAYKDDKFMSISYLLLKYLSRLCLYGAGFFYIEEKTIKINEDKYPKLKFVNENKSKIIISNHVNFIDILVQIQKQSSSFIAKYSVSNLVFIGNIAKVQRCIFVKRDNQSQKLKVVQDLQDRGKEINKGEQLNDFIIFPEGTTTNGKGLITFKKGAFIMDSPLKINILKYNGKITPNFVGIKMMDLLIVQQYINQIKLLQKIKIWNGKNIHKKLKNQCAMNLVCIIMKVIFMIVKKQINKFLEINLIMNIKQFQQKYIYQQ